MASRFEKFSERARRTLSLAQQEAQRFNHNYIGTEHILLGLVRESDCAAARILTNLSVELSKVRSGVEFIIGRGERRPAPGEIGLTPRAKKTIELAVDEARRLNDPYIGTEHLLLGLLREGEGVAADVLQGQGVTIERVRSLIASTAFASLLHEERSGAYLPLRRQAVARVAGLYVIVDPQLTNGRDVVEVARAALKGGATAIQLRDKVHDKGDQLLVAHRLKELCDQFGAAFIVNDHADLAVAANAHGLHVGQHDLPVPEARRILKIYQFIGTSNALPEEAQASLAQEADYLAVGAMYGTTSKEGTRPAGVEALRRVRLLVRDVPVVAIGGINLANVGPVLEAGADGICVISAVGMAEDPEAAARALVERIRAYKAGAS
jgi:thiamine-phosphate diphosphorylase